MKHRSLLLIYLSVFLMSCVSDIAQLPPKWLDDAGKTGDKCSNLSGVYINNVFEKSTNKYNFSEELYLSSFFEPYIKEKHSIEHKTINIVELKASSNRLNLILKRGGEEIFQTTLNKERDFTCTQNHITLNRKWNQVNEFGILTVTEKIDLFSAGGGSVIVKKEKSEKGLALIIPSSYTEVHYYRFMPIESKK